MAFFTDKFLNARREDLLRHIYRFQYQLNGGTWYTGEINSKEVVGTNVERQSYNTGLLRFTFPLIEATTE